MKSILVVDDEASMRALITDGLSDDFAIVGAANGYEALALLDQQRFDLVITDVLMPEMDGIELVMALRKNNPEQKLIAMSGCDINDGNFDFLFAAKKLGNCLGLRKPFHLDELRTAVDELLAQPTP